MVEPQPQSLSDKKKHPGNTQPQMNLRPIHVFSLLDLMVLSNSDQASCGKGIFLEMDLNYSHILLCGGFKDFLFLPLLWEMFQSDDHIFQLLWFNHQV